jgi:hypothetical protein
MNIDSVAPQATTRLIYPQRAQRLTPADLHRLFSPSYEERRWVAAIARRPSSQVALLAQLKIFQAVGRFLPVEQIPEADTGTDAGRHGVARMTARSRRCVGAALEERWAT